MQTVDTRHGPLALDITGAGPPLVLLHSGGHDRRDFDAITPALGARFRVVALDLLGHGGSAHTAPPEAIDTRKISESVIDAVRALGLERPLVLGNSVGGLAALQLASELPVRGLVLVSPSGLIARTWLARTLCSVQGRPWVRRTFGMAFARHYLTLRNEHTRALLARMAERRQDSAFLAMEAALWRSFGRPESDLSALAPSIRCPVALVWGRHDPVIRMRVEGARARRLLPHAAWIELDAGHVPFVEAPEAFLSALEPFFSAALRDAPEAATGAPA